jgi:hypothetical protein
VEFIVPSVSWELTELELRKGDSGSWVVDAETNNILGYVVAISAGSAYLIPLMDLFEQILQDCKPGTPISVPSPFRLLTRLARYHFALEDRGQGSTYAFIALSSKVLDTPPFGQAMLLFKSAIANGESRNRLMQIICTVEEDLWPELGSFSKWSSEQQRKIDQDLVPVLIRMENRIPLSIPEVEIDIVPGTARVVDVEKGKTLQGSPSSTTPPCYHSFHNQSCVIHYKISCSN